MTINKDSTVSLQTQLYQIIMAQLESGELQPGSKIPSERELSEIYSVSRVTSKNAILALLNDGIVIRVPGKGTFIRDDGGLLQRDSAKHKTIAFVLCHPKLTRFDIERDPVFFSVFNGIHEHGHRRGNHVLFQYVDEGSPDEVELFRALLSKVDGVIIGMVKNKMLIRILEQARKPYVSAFPLADLDGRIVVDFDHATAGNRGVNYLIEKGHREIGMIGGPAGDRMAKLRHQGAKQAMQSAGLSVQDNFFIHGDGWFIPDGYKAACELLGRRDLPTSIFCANDLLATGVLKACHEKGIKVPEELSIVGCGNTVLAENSLPHLSSVDIHKAYLGRLAAEHLFALMEDPDFPPITTTMPVRVVERDSVRDINK